MGDRCLSVTNACDNGMVRLPCVDGCDICYMARMCACHVVNCDRFLPHLFVRWLVIQYCHSQGEDIIDKVLGYRFQVRIINLTDCLG